MLNKFNTVIGFILFGILINTLGYQYLFSDMELPPRENIIIIELPEVQPTTPKVNSTELNCMAENIFHEARGQSEEGQYAVAFVTLNRVRHIDFPNTVCDVVFQPFQFSWTFQDVSINLKNPIERRAWEKSMKISLDVLSGNAYNNLYGVTHYHADYVNPEWGYYMVAQIDNHIFYRSF